jgi:large subunit ribosomal protein L25
MSDDFVLNAEERNDVGKGSSRRLRRLADHIPAIIYGGKKKPQSITIPHKDIHRALSNEAFYSHVITLNIGENSEEVILKDLQRHPAKDKVLHADFLRVSKNKKLVIKAPLHFINEDTCTGVKQQGGVIAHAISELEISCLPKDLPEYIEVDMANVELDQSLHISDLTLPEGVESVALSHGEDHDLQVVSVHAPKVAAEPEPEQAEAEGEAEAEEPQEEEKGEDGEE